MQEVYCIDSEGDLTTHFDYIHYNPVSHGLVECTHQWAYSSFHREVKRGNYPSDWGCNCDRDRDDRIHKLQSTQKTRLLDRNRVYVK